jgi:hypothetical protein
MTFVISAAVLAVLSLVLGVSCTPGCSDRITRS